MDRERAYVALGSNLGDRERHLADAIAALAATEGLSVVGTSRLYETAPVGPPGQGPYLNAVVALDVSLGPRALLDRLLAIEDAAGRVRGHVRNAPRTLDLDLLLFGDREIDEPGLTVPHPRMRERPFVLEPLCDLAADLVHPALGESVASLARRVRDPDAVRPHPT